MQENLFFKMLKILKKLNSVSAYLFSLFFLFSSNVFAYGGDIPTINAALQALVDILTGTPAKLFAVIAIAGTGITWMRGKISLTSAGIVALSIGVIFGSPQIARLLGAG
jgi:type IV secretory pathway VirB2 component (pilin)